MPVKKQTFSRAASQKNKKRTIHPNTLAALEKNRVPFKKGDPRINRKGVPKDTIAMRALIRELGGELVQIREELQSRRGTGKGQRMTTEQTVVVSRITELLLRMFASDNPLDHANILKAGWPGLLSEENAGPKQSEMTIRLVYENQRQPLPEDLLDEESAIDADTLDVKGITETLNRDSNGEDPSI